MLDLNDYFDPVSIERPCFQSLSGNAGFPHNIFIHTENNPLKDISGFKVAILGVPEGRNSLSHGTSNAPDSIRRQLYSLARIPGKNRIIDLGNMKQGASFGDTLAGLTDVLGTLSGENVFPVIIGGSSALVSAIDRTFSNLHEYHTPIKV
jgi:arginase family enzyme